MKARRVLPTHEHEWEAAPGLPAALPAGETLLWQGAPKWQALARHAFHVRKVAAYFLAMMALQATQLATHPAAAGEGGELWRPLAVSAALALLALGLLALCAWFAARTTLYTLTNQRVIMRIGIVLTVTFNLPLRRIAGAALHPCGDGTSDIALALYPDDHIGWVHLWPHQRAWHLRHPQPTLRCLPEGDAVASQLLRAWRDHHAAETVRVGPQTSPTIETPVQGVPA